MFFVNPRDLFSRKWYNLTMTVISISSQIGSLGSAITARLAGKLNCTVINREYLFRNYFTDLSDGQRNRLDESSKFYLTEYKNGKSFKDIMLQKVAEECKNADNRNMDIIIQGVGGNAMLNYLNIEHISIRIKDSQENRIRRIRKQNNIDEAAALETINVGDRRSKRFVSTLFEKDINDIENYDLVINTSRVTADEGANLIEAFAAEHHIHKALEAETKNNESMNHQKENVVFKNATEEEFAHILDMYGIEWVYEPKTFPIEWDIAGNIKSAFAPDFYLPRFDMYLELTIMDQKYVTKKNKKLRKVQELYPGTNIKIVYKRDFEELVNRLNGFAGDK